MYVGVLLHFRLLLLPLLLLRGGNSTRRYTCTRTYQLLLPLERCGQNSNCTLLLAVSPQSFQIVAQATAVRAAPDPHDVKHGRLSRTNYVGTNLRLWRGKALKITLHR
jgi:hypothetical protein